VIAIYASALICGKHHSETAVSTSYEKEKLVTTEDAEKFNFLKISKEQRQSINLVVSSLEDCLNQRNKGGRI
jgi:hypothetical protein